MFSIERIGNLTDWAREALAGEGFDNVRVRVGDGTRGWPEEAPFDAIVVAACREDVPDALELVCITRVPDWNTAVNT